MSEFNSCASLVNSEDWKKIEEMYAKFLEKGQDPFEMMLEMQNQLQKELNIRLPYLNPDPDSLKTVGEKIDWMKKNKDAIDDEFRELLTSFGGMSKGEKAASAAWKTWKADHKKTRETDFNSMSKEDRLEIVFEMIDIWHFVMNMFLGLKLTSKDIFILYFLKNKENLRRYSEGY